MNSIVIAQVTSSGSTLILDPNLSFEVPEGGNIFTCTVNSPMGRVEARFLPRDVSTKTIFIRDLGDPRLTLIRSMPLVVESWSDHVTACSYDIEEFGIGADEFAAVDDLKASIADLYFLFDEEQANLGPLPQRQWAFLKGIIRKT